MTTEPDGPADAGADQLTTVLGLLSRHTQLLLGDTIRLEDERWRQPSTLPGWSRGHVATHLARQADALRRLAVGASTGEPGQMYASAEARDDEITAGADRTGLDLQIDLDTSAGALSDAFDAVATADAWGVEVELRGGARCPARLLPLARLNEVVLHHVDLDVGYRVEDVPAETAGWLLELCAFRLRSHPGFPRLTLRPDGAASPVEVGVVGDPAAVAGPAPLLLGWLTGRGDSAGLTGADDVRLPSFG